MFFPYIRSDWSIFDSVNLPDEHQVVMVPRAGGRVVGLDIAVLLHMDELIVWRPIEDDDSL